MNRPRFSLSLVTLFGIPVRVHITFLLLFAWVGFGTHYNTPWDAVESLSFLLAVFGCVTLHEFGHALAAKRFGIMTRDIVLYPIGGVASITGTPTPKQEFLISIAGPLVNVLIATLLYSFVDLEGVDPTKVDLDFVTELFLANVMLALFNLYPAYPMDGGRILRSFLQIVGVTRATFITTRLSQVLSVVLGLFALYVDNPWLVAIAVIVFMNAAQEYLREQTKAGTAGHTARDVMIEFSQLVPLPHGITISEALTTALKSFQAVFPVVLGTRLMGMVYRTDILESGATTGSEEYLASIMQRDVPAVPPTLPLEALLDGMESQRVGAVLVGDPQQPLGVVTHERLIEFLVVNGVRRRVKAAANQSGPERELPKE